MAIGVVVLGVAELWWRTSLAIRQWQRRQCGAAKAVRVSEIVPETSLVDRKKYRVIRLGNDLRVLLIQDTQSSWNTGKKSNGADRRAAVALSIAAGSFEDPPEAPGLAHFLEHMVFMGSTKYPDEDALEDFLQMHSGYSNAHTEAEQTCFYFDIDPPHFGKALDIFAQFFIDPLLKADAVGRERRAVDSEFQLALQDDYSRAQQVVLSRANPDSVVSKFTWGNDESLRTIPLEAGCDILQLLFAFHEKHYKAENMCAAIRGPQSLDELQAMAASTLGGIPRGSGGLRNDGSTFSAQWDHPWSAHDFHKIAYVTPIRDDHKLTLLWNFESLFNTWRVKPMMYVSELVGHEGPGSVLHRLRALRWATALSAGNSGDGTEASSRHCLFQVMATLTDEGLHHVREIIMMVLHYLSMVRAVGPQQRFFDECRQISRNYFRFQQDFDPMDFVEMAACEMPHYPDEHIFDGDTVILEYDADTIAKLMRRLTFRNMMVVVSSKTFEGRCTEKAPWFNTPHAITSFPLDWEAEAGKIEGQQLPCPSFLHMPAPNAFIATDFSFKEKTDTNTEPAVIFECPDIQCWHLHDTTHHVPRAGVRVQLCNKAMNNSARGRVAGDLFVQMVHHALKDELYQAEIADVEFDVRCDEFGVCFSVTGYSSKVDLVFRILCLRLFAFEFQQGVFDMLREKLLRLLANEALNPSIFARELRLTCLCRNIFKAQDLHAALEQLTLQDVLALYRQLLEDNKAVMYVHGNATKEDALSLLSILRTHRSSTTYTAFATQPVLALDPGFLVHRAENKNTHDVNNVLEMYFQVQETDRRSQTVHRLLSNMIEEPFFQELRTKQQLGYSVFLSRRSTYNKPGFVASIASPSDKFSSRTLVERTEAFLTKFAKTLRNMSKKEFKSHKESLHNALLAPDANQDRRISKLWFAIQARTFEFSRKPEADYLKTITKQEVLDMFLRYLHPDSKDRAVLAVIVNSTQEKVSPLDNEHALARVEDLRQTGRYVVWTGRGVGTRAPKNTATDTPATTAAGGSEGGARGGKHGVAVKAKQAQQKQKQKHGKKKSKKNRKHS